MILLLARLALASDLSNATVVVAVQDEDGKPIRLSWHGYDPVFRYGSSEREDAGCFAVSVSRGTFADQYCVSNALVNGTKVDGRVSSQGPGSGSWSPTTTFGFDLYEGDSYFTMNALPGTRTVQFPEGIRTSQGMWSPVDATESWDFEAGKVYVLTLRRASQVRVVNASSLGAYWIIDHGREVKLVDGAFIRPGSYEIRWASDAYAWLYEPLCAVIADASVPAGIPVDLIANGIPTESRHCAPGYFIQVSLGDDHGLVWEKLAAGDSASATFGTGTAPGVYVNGVSVRSGDIVTVDPGKDLVVEVRTSLASGN